MTPLYARKWVLKAVQKYLLNLILLIK
jgi:hypothetical protein